MFLVIVLLVNCVELSKAESDRNAMKEQSDGIKREYDRLMKEFDTYRVCI